MLTYYSMLTVSNIYHCTVCSDAFDLQFGVIIFRLRAGFDATDHEQQLTPAAPEPKGKIAKSLSLSLFL